MMQWTEDEFDDFMITPPHQRGPTIASPPPTRTTTAATPRTTSMSLPLAGASIYVLTPRGDRDDGEEEAAVWGANVEALGGERVVCVADATHALWVGGDNGSAKDDALLRELLAQCRAHDVPVVDASSWLGRVSGLRDGEHWSEVDVAVHVPPLEFALLGGGGNGIGESDSAYPTVRAPLSVASGAGPVGPRLSVNSAATAEEDAIAMAMQQEDAMDISPAPPGRSSDVDVAMARQLQREEQLREQQEKLLQRARAQTAAQQAVAMQQQQQRLLRQQAAREEEDARRRTADAYAAAVDPPVVDADPEPEIEPIGGGGDDGADDPPSAGNANFWQRLSQQIQPPSRSGNKGRRREKEKDSGRDMGQIPAGSGRGRTEKRSKLTKSISETWDYLRREAPDAVEEDEIRRAIELSMLDCALVQRKRRPGDGGATRNRKIAHERPPHEILGVAKDATPKEIRRAYRRKALETHPDRKKRGSGGLGANAKDDDEFQAVARAYRSMLNISQGHDDEDITRGGALKSTAHWDTELRNHRTLVDELFVNHGSDLTDSKSRQGRALEALGLMPRDAGSTNRNEKNEKIANSCFYLSLATSYLAGIGALEGCFGGGGGNDEAASAVYDADGDVRMDERALREADDALVGETALTLKRIVEAAVVSSHPEWAARGMVGEEVQAFSDFLVYVLDSPNIVSDWAVVVFDAASGFVDVYKGKHYDSEGGGAVARSNTITVRYEPGHYQPLLPVSGRSRPALVDILAELDRESVFYVITDGSTP